MRAFVLQVEGSGESGRGGTRLPCGRWRVQNPTKPDPVVLAVRRVGHRLTPRQLHAFFVHFNHWRRRDKRVGSRRDLPSRNRLPVCC